MQLIVVLALRREGHTVVVLDYPKFHSAIVGGPEREPEWWKCLTKAGCIIGGIDFSSNFW